LYIIHAVSAHVHLAVTNHVDRGTDVILSTTYRTAINASSNPALIHVIWSRWAFSLSDTYQGNKNNEKKIRSLIQK